MFTTTRSLIPESREWYRRVIRNHRPSRTSSKERAATQYARNKLVELQEKFDQLEELGVFKHPEDIGISIEYLNPSFLVKKQSGGYRLITAFADVGRYSKPQPSVMPDVDSTLRHIAQWKHLMSTFQGICTLRNGYAWIGNSTGRAHVPCPWAPATGRNSRQNHGRPLH